MAGVYPMRSKGQCLQLRVDNRRSIAENDVDAADCVVKVARERSANAVDAVERNELGRYADDTAGSYTPNRRQDSPALAIESGDRMAPQLWSIERTGLHGDRDGLGVAEAEDQLDATSDRVEVPLV